MKEMDREALGAERYQRQILIEGLGESGQRKLREATVFIAGAGGLGSPAAYYLAAAGVGRIRIGDSDRVELSNLNRQILHSEERIGTPKALSAARTLQGFNSAITVEGIETRITAETAAELFSGADIILDCLDNVETRYILNRYARDTGTPIVHGGINGLAGQMTLIIPGKTPCLGCLFPFAPAKMTIPVLGAAAGVIGSLQAIEAVKYLTGTGRTAENRLIFFDGSDGGFETIPMERNPRCPHCSPRGGDQ